MRLINSRSCSLFFQVKSYEIILKGHRTIIVSIHEFPVSVTCSQLVHTKPQALQLWVVSWHHRTPDPLSWSYKNNFIVLKILWNHYDLYVLKTRGTFSFLHIIYPRQPSRPIYAFPFSLCQSQLLPIFVDVCLSNPGAHCNTHSIVCNTYCNLYLFWDPSTFSL